MNRYLPIKQAAFLLAGVVLSALLAFGQVTTATVYGRVTDNSNAVLPGASATLTNNATHAVFHATSDNHGEFTFNFVPNGSYTLDVTEHGFKTLKQNLDLAAGQNVRLNLGLQVGKVMETVNVEAPMVNAVNAEQHDTVGTEQIHELPIQHSNWTSLLQLDNGVSLAGQGGVSLNGLAPSGFTLTVNGTAAAGDPEMSSLNAYQNFDVIKSVNPDAIAEVSVTKGIAPASQSGSMSGNVNIITKGGSNHFHGNLFYGNQNNSYSATPRFVTLPHLVYNEYGGDLGGPILHNRVFFFGSYEGVISHETKSVHGNVPTPEFRQQAIAAIPASAAYLNLYPNPTAAYAPGAITAAYFGNRSQIQDDNNTVLRLDGYINQTNLITAMLDRSRPIEDQPNVMPTGGRNYAAHNDKYNVSWTHSRSAWSSQLRFGYNRMRLARYGQRYSNTVAAIDGLGFSDGQSEVFLKNGFTSTIEETIALTKGRHSIQFGGDFGRNNSGRTDLETPSVSYANATDFFNNQPSNVFASGGLVPFTLHSYSTGLFFQDDFKVRPNLTLNLGVRYDYFSVPKEQNGLLENRNNSGFGSPRPANSMYNADFNNFQPRFGFSWALGQNRSTIIRGGSGVFVTNHPIYGGPIEIPINPNGVPFEVNFGAVDAQNLGLKYPVTNQEVVALATSGPPLANSAIAANFPDPYSIQWTLGVQRQIGSNMLAEVDYVGNHALKMNTTEYLNLPDRLTGIAPAPGFGTFRYYSATDASTYEALQASLNRRFTHGLSFQANYTYAQNRSFGSADNLLNTAPQDNNNIRADLGPTPYDIRHNFTANLVYQVPFTSKNSFLAQAISGWQVSTIFSANTGLPTTISQSSSYRSSRPDAVPGVSPYMGGNWQSSLQYLNPAAFALVPISSASKAEIRPGTLGRNTIRLPGYWNEDLSAAKSFALTEGMHLQFRADIFNIFNHSSLGGLQTTVARSTFGQLTSASAPRILQLNLKLTF